MEIIISGIIVALLVGLDQLTKFLAELFLKASDSIVIIDNVIELTFSYNTGAAFSLFQGNTWLLIGIGVLAVIGFTLYIGKLVDIGDFDMFTYSLLLGGVLGNLIDRIVHGYVIDYISLNIFGYHFPIFNFADMCIVISVILIFISAFKGDLWRE
jgi:signal peptidase II